VNLRKNPDRGEDPEITVVSFIDVLLCLLIFFMASTTFVDEARLKVQLPEASVEREAQPVRDAIEITITRQGGYSVNGRSLINSSAQTLAAAVTQVALDARDVPITIRADGQATHQSVVTAMDVVGRLGFRTINIATINEGPDDAAGAAR
jgi:biopolymer transport protein ExbD